MKFAAVYGLVTFLFVSTAVAANVPALLGRSTDTCTPTPNCDCAGYSGGLWCGIQLGCEPYDSVFQCNGDDGATCVFGYSVACHNCDQPKCD